MDLDDAVRSEEPVAESWEYLCIHEIARLEMPPIQPNKGVPPTSPPVPDQIEMPPDHELMDLEIPEGILDLLDVPEEVISDFEA